MGHAASLQRDVAGCGVEDGQSHALGSAAEPPSFKQRYHPREQSHVCLRGIFPLLWEGITRTTGEKLKTGRFKSEAGKKINQED